MKLPTDEVMRQMSKMAMEKATTYFAEMAETFARGINPNINGPDALLAFAKAIRATNVKLYPTDTEQ